MTKFDQKSFGIGAPKDNKYRDNWDSVFGKKEEPEEPEEPEKIQEQLESLHATIAEQLKAMATPAYWLHHCDDLPCQECTAVWLCEDCWSKIK